MKAGHDSAAAARQTPSAEGFDLLSLRPMRRVVQSKLIPRVLQWPMLALFLGLIALGWGVFTPAGVNDKLFARAHLVTLLVWGLWWPLMVWAAVAFGRVWCLVCPLELVNDLGERAAHRAGRAARSLPRWLAGGAVILLLYVSAQLLVAGAHLHRVPAYTAWYLTGLLLVALAAGAIYRDRAFCRGFCPVGLLLGVYGRGGMLAVRPGPNRGPGAPPGPDVRSCPSLLHPSRLADNADCLVCTHCYKDAAPGSMRLVLRRPFSRCDARLAMASWPVTGFVMVASGFVLSELCSEWAAAKGVFLAAPKWAAAQLGWTAGGGWIEGLWTLFVVPILLWVVLAAVWRLAGERGAWTELWRRMALPVAVIVAAGHMSKGLAKLVSWWPYLPGAWREPAGLETAQAIARGTASAPLPLVALPVVAGIGLVLLAAAGYAAIREYRLACGDIAGTMRGAIPLGLLTAAFAAIVAGWAVA